MIFEQNDMQIELDCLHSLTYEKNTTEMLDVIDMHYWYDCSDGWGSISGEYLRRDDIHHMCAGLSAVTKGKRAQFEFTFDYLFYRSRPFLKIYLERTEEGFRFVLCVNDEFGDNVIDQQYTLDQWVPYLHEFIAWNSFPAQT